MVENIKLADQLYPDVKMQVREIIDRYPPRDLPAGAMVTRLAPSPTGELHIGTLYAAFLSYSLAMQSGGVFYVRLDDTDQKREVSGTRKRIPHELCEFGIEYGKATLQTAANPASTGRMFKAGGGRFIQPLQSIWWRKARHILAFATNRRLIKCERNRNGNALTLDIMARGRPIAR
jgi:hypothetical protein